MNEERKELEETHPMEQPESLTFREFKKLAAPSDDVCYPQKPLPWSELAATDGVQEPVPRPSDIQKQDPAPAPKWNDDALEAAMLRLKRFIRETYEDVEILADFDLVWDFLEKQGVIRE